MNTAEANKVITRNIPFSPPDITDLEVEEVGKALKSGWITTGPRTKLLERRIAAYIETGRTNIDCELKENIEKYSNKVVCLNSATAAEELNFRLLGIGEGDEVIVPAYTYTASASAAIHCGAKVVFVDIQKDGDKSTHMPEIDYDKLEAAITEKTKAIVMVDLGGIPGDFEKVYDIVEKTKNKFTPCDKHETPLDNLSTKIQRGLGRIAVFADCAHSLGASRTFHGVKTYAGRLADISSFSFHAVKNFTTAEGGASTWMLPTSVYEAGVTDEEIYHMYQLLSLHGQSKDALAKTKIGAWEYDIVGPWYKCNMTDIMAGMGLKQMDRYEDMLNRRAEIVGKYDAVCDELGYGHLNHHIDGINGSKHLYLVRLPEADEEKRNEFIIKMAELGVATNVHYKPLPMMTAYKALGADIKDYPNSYDYYKNEVTLPLHTCLTDEDVEYIVSMIRSIN